MVVVFSRERDDEFVIRTESAVLATVRIVDIRGSKVRVGVETHGPNIEVQRSEVFEALKHLQGPALPHSNRGSTPADTTD